MRQPQYPQCIKCTCPLTRLNGEVKHRALCIRCHESMARNSVRNKNACYCAQIDKCHMCYMREARTKWRIKNPEKANEQWADYYYRDHAKVRQTRNAQNRRRYAAKKEASCSVSS